LTWDYLDNAIDFIFMTDIILTFLSAAYDDEGNLITERKAIILNYLKGWFIIDLMVIRHLTHSHQFRFTLF